MFDVRTTFEIPRLNRPSRRELEERFLVPHRPVIITGAMDDWPALTRWTHDYLKAKIGARSVRPTRAHEGMHFRKHKEHFVYKAPPMPFAEYIDLVASGGLSARELYAAQLPIKRELPELWGDLAFPSYIEPARFSVINFWLGPGGNVTPLHYDYAYNFLTQIRGKKEIILFPPEEIARLYPFPVSYISHHVSQVNVTAPDLARFPDYERTERALCELHPGEMLFIPFYWWHAVHGIGENMSLNFFWHATKAQQLQHPRQTARGLGSQVFHGLRRAAGVARKVAQRAGIQTSR